MTAAEPINPGTTAESKSDNFEAVAGQILNENPAAQVPAQEPAAPGEPVPIEQQGVVLPPERPEVNEFVSAFANAEQVKKWLPIPFEMIAEAMKNPDAKLKGYELDMGAPAVAAVGRKFLPGWLANTKEPELIMLGLFLMAYLSRLGLAEWMTNKKKAKEQPKESPRPDTPQADSTKSPVFTERTVSSGKPEPEKAGKSRNSFVGSIV